MSSNSSKNEAAPDPKKPKPQDILSETEGEELVNGQSDTQIINSSDPLPADTIEDMPSEEEEDEKLNNLRDALNSDELALPPDERDDDVMN